MPSKSVEFAPLARADLAEIWWYSAENWSAEQADAYIDEIDDVISALADGRKSGRPVDVRPPYQRIHVRSHTIFFQTTTTSLTVSRILHQSMDARRHL